MNAPLAALAAALERRLAGGIIQEVHAGAEGLLVLSVRLPGESVHVGFSVLDGATGAALLGGVRARAAGRALDGLRDRARAALGGRRITAVLHGDEPPRLALAVQPPEGEIAALVLREERHGGNLAVIAGGAAHALRASGPQDAHVARWLAGLRTGVEEAGFELEAASAGLLARRAEAVARQGLADLVRRLRTARAAAQRLALKRGDDVDRQRDPAEARARADALAAVLHLVRRGDARIEGAHPADGQPLAIDLDPKLAPGQNLEKAYAAAARAERGLERARAMLLEAETARDRLEDLEARARAAQDAGTALECFESLQSEAAPLLPARRGPDAPAAAPAKTWPAGVAAHVSQDGHVILVGRTAQANDLVTFRLARGNDPWLHARDSPGPHVVLMLPKGAEIPQESLLDAATLAHAFSQRGDDVRGEVVWCRAKDVRKPKGAPPGKVTLVREKTLSLRVEPERLARLRASRR